MKSRTPAPARAAKKRVIFKPGDIVVSRILSQIYRDKDKRYPLIKTSHEGPCLIIAIEERPAWSWPVLFVLMNDDYKTPTLGWICSSEVVTVSS